MSEHENPSRSSKGEQAPYKGQDVGSTPTGTTDDGLARLNRTIEDGVWAVLAEIRILKDHVDQLIRPKGE